MEINTNLTEKGRRDYKLIRKALDDGDQSAYAQLLRHYYDGLYFMMLKMTQNPHDAEDLTIEAFGKAFKSLHQYTPEYAFSTWLFKIATNNCIDFMRTRNKTTRAINGLPGQTEDDQPTRIPAGNPDPEEQFIRSQKIELMHQVVEKLKPHYKKLIELRYFKEYTYEEITKELDLPLGTVKAQLFRAREFLYNILKNSKERI
jgi:RNA polymerase sigma-70 factor (ECF subfamily)